MFSELAVVVSDHKHVVIVMPEEDVAKFEHRQVSMDVTDMEELKIELQDGSTFLFDCDDGKPITDGMSRFRGDKAK